MSQPHRSPRRRRAARGPQGPATACHRPPNHLETRKEGTRADGAQRRATRDDAPPPPVRCPHCRELLKRVKNCTVCGVRRIGPAGKEGQK
jgi:hypothetical protein